jgi:class 3 adenylate cyclase
MRANPTYYSMIVVDVVGFSRRDDRFQRKIREALRDVLVDAFTEAGVSVEHVVTEDRGDGKLMLIPADVSAYQLIDPLVARIAVGLRQHNSVSSDDARIRLRMALHQGMVQRDADGWVGSDLNTTFRLVDSEPLRAAVVEHPEASLVLIVSESIYQSIVRHGHGAIEPETYHQVSVDNKETSTVAWIHVSAGHQPRERSGQPRPDAPRGGGGGASFGTVVAFGDVVGRDKIIGEPR